MWKLYKRDISAVAIGAKFLGCGGGGDPFIVEMLIKSVMNDEESIHVLEWQDLTDQWIAPIAIIGSPEFYSEQLPSGDEGRSSLKLYEEYTNTEPQALISLEIGGLNGISPILTALRSRLPIVDGDGMGRAFPKLKMSVLNLAVPLTPAAVYTHNYQEVIDFVPNEKASEYLHSVVQQNGGFAHLTSYVGNAKKISTAMIPGTLTVAKAIGEIIEKQIGASDKQEQLQKMFGNSIYGKVEWILSGVIEQVERDFYDGVVTGRCLVRAHSVQDYRMVTIFFENEFVYVASEHDRLATTPDLIVVCEMETLRPLMASTIQKGTEITIAKVACPSILKTEKMRNLYKRND
ncbi:LOW QUALITY PROTEIN: hypothetical protein JCM19055_3727 [Geomicrobium sp. JCM 19055]|nr:LOW QUALITY PROTEIN: hypothetical protein JCM19055_3727 [Geomicrobium sp. JCM 19055]